MKVMVCGGRDYDNQVQLYSVLDDIHANTPIKKLIHGNGRGADMLAQMWANERGVNVTSFPAEWGKYNKAAGPIRNQAMVDDGPHLVVAFPGGSGTADSVTRARRRGLPVIMVPR